MNTPAAYEFNIIPSDFCPRCEPTDERLGHPVAVAIAGPHRAITRYICPECRLTWDSAQDMNSDEFTPFRDRFVAKSELIEAHPDGLNWCPARPDRPTNNFTTEASLKS